VSRYGTHRSSLTRNTVAKGTPEFGIGHVVSSTEMVVLQGKTSRRKPYNAVGPSTVTSVLLTWIDHDVSVDSQEPVRVGIVR
jgi:hypothetical protein